MCMYVRERGFTHVDPQCEWLWPYYTTRNFNSHPRRTRTHVPRPQQVTVWVRMLHVCAGLDGVQAREILAISVTEMAKFGDSGMRMVQVSKPDALYPSAVKKRIPSRQLQLTRRDRRRRFVEGRTCEIYQI